MKSPWKDNDDAFCPMFDETIAIKTIDGNTTSFEVAMFSNGTSDPFSDDMIDTEREDVMFVFKQEDWPFVKAITRGTTITACNMKQYSVSEAKLDNCFGWVIVAREK